SRQRCARRAPRGHAPPRRAVPPRPRTPDSAPRVSESAALRSRDRRPSSAAARGDSSASGGGKTKRGGSRNSGSRPAHLCSVAARVPQVAVVVGTHGDDALRRLAAPRPILPRMEPASHVRGVDVEHVADVLDGEQTRAIAVLDPLLRSPEQLLVACLLRRRLLPVYVHRVFEYRDHQPALAVVLDPPTDSIEELRRQQCVGREQRTQSLLWGFAFLHGYEPDSSLNDDK